MKKRPLLVIAFLFILGICLCHQPSMATSGEISVIDYPSIQEAIDANPGQMVHIPAGDYEIAKPILLNATGSGLFGYGRIIQTNPEAHILVISRADDVRVSDLTLTRPEDKPGKRSALVAGHCRNLTLRGLQVIDTRAPAGAINIEYCDNTQILDCIVQNYATVSIEDRTGNENYGYAYKSIDGTGIQVSGTGILIQGNRVIQTELFPTPETQKEFQLGEFVNKNKKRGSLINEKAWEEGYTKNWNQGSSIHVGDPETSSHVQILGNYIEHGAQGVDIHGDQVTLANNITNGAFLGMKAMHGSKNTLIVGNQFSKCDINGVLLQPGVASHAAGAPERPDGNPEANVDGGSIVAKNMVSDFGYGNSNWIWGNERYPFEFSAGQMPDDPPLSDVIVEGNILYDPGRDGILVEGKPQVGPPRYLVAVEVSPDNPAGLKGPVNVLFANNLFDPGTQGVSKPLGLIPE